jgi:hypothetical protein
MPQLQGHATRVLGSSMSSKCSGHCGGLRPRQGPMLHVKQWSHSLCFDHHDVMHYGGAGVDCPLQGFQCAAAAADAASAH